MNTEADIKHFVQWQGNIDLLADFFETPFITVAKVKDHMLEVILTFSDIENTFKRGDQFNFDFNHSSKSENTHLQINFSLLKNNAEINKAPIKKQTCIPIYLPNDELYGAICIFNKEERNYAPKLLKLLNQHKQIMEADLAASFNLHNQKSEESPIAKESLYEILYEKTGTINCFFNNKLELKLYNESFYKMFSNKIPMLKNGVLNTEHEHEKNKIFDRLKQAIQTNTIQKHTTLYSFNGQKTWLTAEYIPVTINHEVIGVNVIALDVTDLVKTEQLVKDNAKVLRDYERIYKLVANPICIANIQAVFLKVNPAMGHILGYPTNEIEGKSMFDFIHPEDVERTIAYIEEKIVEQPEIMRFENRYVCKNGTSVWFSWIIQPIYSEGISFSVAHDITKLKEIEKELIVAKEKAEESDHLKTAFLCNMSHEIRTPMNGIVGFSDILKNTNFVDDKSKSYCDIISESGQQLLRIVNDIIDVSKIEIGQVDIYLSNTCIHELIEGLIKFYKPIAKKRGIDIFSSFELKDRHSIINSDVTKLRQILDNLISNALKFTHKGFVKVAYKLTEDYIVFSVEDSGIGIAKDQIQNVFVRFHQADINKANLYGGTGLGLAISKAYVERMGGKIWLESQPEIGTKFYFSLPHPNTQAH